MNITQQNDRKIYILYHYPCLDGIFALMNLLMIIKARVSFDNYSFEKLYETIEITLKEVSLKTEIKPSNFEDGASILSQKICHENQEQRTNYQQQVELDKGFFYSEVFPQIVYVPMSIGNSKSEVLQYFDNRNENNKTCYQNSILIMLDYFGRSIESIQKLTIMFKNVIILDHHSTATNELSKISQFDQKNKTLQQVSDNLYVFINEDIAGCDITIQFCEQLFGQSYESLLPEPLYKQLKLFTKHVSDHDLYTQVHEQTEPLIMAIFKLTKKSQFQSANMDLDARQNPIIFHQIYSLDFNYLLNIGKGLMKKRDERILILLPKRKIMKIDNFKGYGVRCDEKELLNELGHQLAQLSLQDGFDNLGIVHYQFHCDNKNVKIHLRSYNKGIKTCFCDKLAEFYGGGGHKGASSFKISNKQFKEMI